MIIYKIVAAVKNLFEYLGLRTQKKSNNKVANQPELNDFNQKKLGKPSWLVFFEKKILSLNVLRQGGRNLSQVEKRRIFWRKTTKVFVSVAFGLAILFAIQEPIKDIVTSIQIFQIKEIVISGCHMTDQGEIKSLANLDYNSSIFTVNPERVVLQLMEHPWIKKAKVKRQWPNGISIELVEHSTNAMMVSGPPQQERFFYINSNGEPIAPVQVGQNIDYPVITGINNLSDEKREVAIKDAVAFLKEISRNDPNLPAQSVSEIHLDKDNGMVIHLVEFPFPIYFGTGEVKKKYKQLRKVLAVLYKKRNRNMDIRKVEYIRVDYLENKVLIARTESG